jgi:phosphoglycolate phosphatase
VRRLILWDIDGTLITSAGASLRAIQAALRAGFGIADSLADIEVAGRTDPWIMRQVFRKFRLDDSPQNFARLFEEYLAALPAELSRSGACILPGVLK